MISSHQFLSEKKERKTVSQTDVGIKIKEQVKDLKNLVNAFKQGIIKEIYDK